MTKLRISISNGVTRKDLIKTLKKVNKRAAMETLENIPVLSTGKVNGLQCMMSGLR